MNDKNISISKDFRRSKGNKTCFKTMNSLVIFVTLKKTLQSNFVIPLPPFLGSNPSVVVQSSTNGMLLLCLL